MAPCCLTHIEFDIDLPEEDVIQVKYKTSVHLSSFLMNQLLHLNYFH